MVDQGMDMEEELKEAKERIARLEACLIRITKLAYSAIKDARNFAANDLDILQCHLDEAKTAGLDQWLPSFADARGASNDTEETLVEASKRRDRHCIEAMLRAMSA